MQPCFYDLRSKVLLFKLMLRKPAILGILAKLDKLPVANLAESLKRALGTSVYRDLSFEAVTKSMSFRSNVLGRKRKR